ncbi:hypothetical protein Tco_0585468 [Tanacetum coccineum]
MDDCGRETAPKAVINHSQEKELPAVYVESFESLPGMLIETRHLICKSNKSVAQRTTYPNDRTCTSFEGTDRDKRSYPAKIVISLTDSSWIRLQMTSECRMVASYAGFPETVETVFPVRTNQHIMSSAQGVAN